MDSIQVEVRPATSAPRAPTTTSTCESARPALPLDKRLYDDFERGDRDTYSVPIDDAVEAGLKVGDITRVQIEKSHGRARRRLAAARGQADRQRPVVYDTARPSAGSRTPPHLARAGLHRTDPRGQVIPVWLNLRESDSVYGKDDEGDINPYDGRDTIGFSYNPATEMRLMTKGGNALGGRIDSGGDHALVEFSLETITPQPSSIPLTPARVVAPRPPGSPIDPTDTTPPALPDLTVSHFNLDAVIVTNKGDGAAGPFRLKLAMGNGEQTLTFPGLGPHESVSRPSKVQCEGGFAEVTTSTRSWRPTSRTIRGNSKRKSAEPPPGDRWAP